MRPVPESSLPRPASSKWVVSADCALIGDPASTAAATSVKPLLKTIAECRTVASAPEKVWEALFNTSAEAWTLNSSTPSPSLNSSDIFGDTNTLSSKSSKVASAVEALLAPCLCGLIFLYACGAECESEREIRLKTHLKRFPPNLLSLSTLSFSAHPNAHPCFLPAPLSLIGKKTKHTAHVTTLGSADHRSPKSPLLRRRGDKIFFGGVVSVRGLKSNPSVHPSSALT